MNPLFHWTCILKDTQKQFSAADFVQLAWEIIGCNFESFVEWFPQQVYLGEGKGDNPPP